MNYNAYMNRHFAELQHVGHMPDPHRNRIINAYIIPGDEDNLGFTDGVDAWIAPRHDYLKRLKQGDGSGPPKIARREVTRKPVIERRAITKPIIQRRPVNGLR